MRLTLDLSLIYAAAQDAGNRHMRENGRTSWDMSDHDEACEEYCRLFALARDQRLADGPDPADRD